MNSNGNAMIRALFFFIACVLNHAAFGQTADIEFSDQWAAPSIGASKISIAFITIQNNTEEPLSLVGVDGEVSDVIEIHTHLHEDGMMKMRQLEELPIPAHEKVVMEPSGIHLMLIGLHEPLNTDDSLKLTLRFANGQTADTTVMVKQR